MAAPLSFTRENSVRYPAPDVARGFMLLLIAVANVNLWADAVGARVFDERADGVLIFLRHLLVDHRAYPLFAMLFGFGLMTMVKRRKAAYIDTAVENLVAQGYGEIAPGSPVTVRGLFATDAVRAARRLLRNRGWWMLVFGAIHGLLFPGDIIGTYAIVCLIFVGTLSHERYRSPLIIGAVVALLGIPVTYGVAIWAPESFQPHDSTIVTLDYSPMGIVEGMGRWVGGAVGGALFSMVMFSVGVGTYLASTDIITHPDKHRRLLTITALVGFLEAIGGGLPLGLIASQIYIIDIQWWMFPLDGFAGVAGAMAWLAVMVGFAGSVPASGKLVGVRWLMSALGRRSLSAYLLQSIFFAAICLPLAAAGAHLSELSAVLIAVGVWVVTVVLAAVLERLGKQGPFEWLLRRLVLKTTRPVLATVVPARYAWLPPCDEATATSKE